MSVYHNICPINMYVCARFHEIPAKGLQDIKETIKCYGRRDNVKTVYPPYNFVIGGGIKNVLNSVLVKLELNSNTLSA